LAKAVAGEAGVPFFHMSGSEFDEMYVGVGARRVRDLFSAAKAKSPCIIFIDEIDAIGGTRSVKEQSAMKMTLNQLLVEMDGFEQNSGVIVIAATNFPDSLDTALTRPGRLDKHVDVPTPDIGGRKAILELYGKRVPLGSDVNLEQIARGTPGFSGAELYNLVNQAALKASVDGLKSVGMAALEYAKDKIMMGSERKSAVISPETMKMTAFHEAGHALVALKTEGADPIHKATIMPRGRALGMVMQLPDGDQTSYSRKQMLARLDVCMGGRVAEEIVYGAENVTSGASSDIQQATRLANAMVTKYGLSEKVGVMFLDDKNKGSGETQKFVDDEVRTLLNESYNRAKKILETNRKELDIIAKGLLDYESLSGGEIVSLLKGVAPNVKLRSQAPSRSTKPLPPMPGQPSTATPSPVASVTSTSSSNNISNKQIANQVISTPQKQTVSNPPSAPPPSVSTTTPTSTTTKTSASTTTTNRGEANRGPPKA
jgi:ATP-dependent metalloprotease